MITDNHDEYIALYHLLYRSVQYYCIVLQYSHQAQYSTAQDGNVQYMIFQ